MIRSNPGEKLLGQWTPQWWVWQLGKDYVEAAEILLDYNRIQPAVVIAALGLEVCLKSFLVIRYQKGIESTTRKHDLVDLWHLIDSSDQRKIAEAAISIEPKVELVTSLEKHRKLFEAARYRYESSAPFSIGSDAIYLARLVCDAVLKVIEDQAEVTH